MTTKVGTFKKQIVTLTLFLSVKGKINTAVLANLQVSNVLNGHKSPHGPDNPSKHK